jgi:hypothetical protein
MGRVRKLAPVSSAVSVEDIRECFDWAGIEQAIDREIAPAAREQICRATQIFTQSAEFEANAPSLTEAEDRLKRLASTTEEAWRALLRETGGGSDVAAYIKDLIGRNLLGSATAVMSDLLVEYGNAKRTLSELRDNPAHRYEEGMAWREWIRALTEIAIEHGIPTGVRTDTRLDPDKTASRFVMFIGKLQASIPQRFRRHTHSSEALAKAITRSRDRKMRTHQP